MTDEIIVDIAGGEYPIKAFPVTEIWYARPYDGTLTAGTITYTVKGPGSQVFETPSDNTIDVAAPERKQIDGTVSVLNISVAGAAGTATKLVLSYVGSE